MNADERGYLRVSAVTQFLAPREGLPPHFAQLVHTIRKGALREAGETILRIRHVQTNYTNRRNLRLVWRPLVMAGGGRPSTSFLALYRGDVDRWRRPPHREDDGTAGTCHSNRKLVLSNQSCRERHLKAWPVQDAKARFSEMLDACLRDGPQMVTRRGTDAAVLVPMREWQRLKEVARPSLKELLLTEAGRGDIQFRRGRLRRRVPRTLS